VSIVTGCGQDDGGLVPGRDRDICFYDHVQTVSER
jgi:hypothetical protein